MADGTSRSELPLVGADLVHLVAEGLDASVEGIQRKGSDTVGPLAQALCGDHRPDPVGTHELRTVQQSQSGLRLQFDGLPAQLRKDLAGRSHLALILDLAQSQQRQTQMGQRRQITRCPQRPLLIDHRQNVAVEELDEPFDRGQLHARITVGQRLDFEEQNQADDLRGDAFARSAGVRHDQIALQLRQIVASDRNVAQRAETGRDAVDRTVGILHLAIEVFAATDNAAFGIVREVDLQMTLHDFADAGNGQPLRRDMMIFHVN